MDEDLAFCLECFVDDQIEEGAREVEEDVHELEIEQDKLSSDIDHEERTICARENQIVEQFSTELQGNNTNLIKARQLVEAELRVILNRASLDIDTIAAKATGQQASDEVRTASNRLRRQNEQFDSEVTRLIDTIDRAKTRNCSEHLASWYQQHFKYIEDLSEMIVPNEYQKVSKDPLIERALGRAQVWETREKLIYDFIRQLEMEDPASNEYLIDSLHDRKDNTVDLIKFASAFVQEHQEERRRQREEVLHEMKRVIEEKRLEQQTRAIQLAAALRQLAVGSANANQFDQKFKQVLNQSNVSERVVPIVMGQIDQPAVKELPLTMRLDADFDTWSTNRSAIRQQFCSTLSNAFGFPKDAIRITRVEQGSAVLFIRVQAPYGQVVVDKLSNVDSTSSEGIERIRKCCAKYNSRIYSITVGEYGLDVAEKVMDPRWNKVYNHSHGQPGGTFWAGSLDRGGQPYFCPKGWIRYGISRANSAADFDKKWGSWHIAYHGTRGVNAPLILKSGLRSSVGGCYKIAGRSRVYLTPSIEYAAHPRYARPWQKQGDKKQWYQLVFQCRVNPASVGRAYPETLIKQEYKQTIDVDGNFPNQKLEWIIPAETAHEEFIRDNIVCYGLMVRKSACDTRELAASKWWQYAHADKVDYDSV